MSFQDYLIDKGWVRTFTDYSNGKEIEIESKSNFVSSYSPTFYSFRNSNFSDIQLWWGLNENGKPPVMCLNRIKFYPLTRADKYLNEQDLWVNTLRKFDYDAIYNLIITEGIIYVKNGELFLTE